MRKVLCLAMMVAVVAVGCGSSGGPATGTERGPCYGNGTCNAGLVCGSGLCVRLGEARATDGAVSGREASAHAEAGPPAEAPAPGGDGGTGAGVTVLAYGQIGASYLALYAGTLYWTIQGPSGSVMKMPATGGTATPIASDLYQPLGIAAGPTGVYWEDSNGCSTKPHGVMWEPAAGGVPTVLVTSDFLPGALAIDSTYVYYAVTNVAPVGIFRVPLTGGGTTTLYTASGGPFAVFGLAVDSVNAYWVVQSGGLVQSVALAGSPPVTIASGENSPWSVAVDGTNVYWTDNTTSGSIMKAPVSGGTPTALATGQPSPWGIAVSGGTVYFTDQGGAGFVMKVPAAGGATTTIASGQGSPQGIVVDSTYVYWADNNYGLIMRAPR